MAQFNREKDAVISAVSNSKKESMVNKALNAINEIEWHRRYVWIYSNVMKEFALQTMQSFNDLKSDVNLDEDLIDEMGDYMEDAIAVHEKEVIETTRSRLKKLLLAAIAKGLSNSAIKILIRRFYDDQKHSRSKTIAETEVIGAGNASSFFVAQYLGAFQKIWITMQDERVRLSHQLVNNEYKPIDELFSNGLMFPGDATRGDAAAICNCRCVLSFKS